MNKPPAFQFYVDNFVEGTSDFDAQEVGQYVLLLCHQWSRGRIPADAERRNRVARSVVSPAVLEKFKNGKNARLEKEREKQEIWRQKSSFGGKKSAEKRSRMVQPPLEPPYQPNGQPKGQPKGNIPLSGFQSPSNKSTKYHKASKKPHGGKFSAHQTDITARMHKCLDMQWENDRQKWMGRIKRMTEKTERVVAEVESAIKESRIKTTPAQYAEEIWKEFK